MYTNTTLLSVGGTSINEPLIKGFLKSKGLTIKAIDLLEGALTIDVESEVPVILDSCDVETFTVYQDNKEIFSYRFDAPCLELSLNFSLILNTHRE